MKHALDDLREVSLKLNNVRDEIFELEMQMGDKRRGGTTAVEAVRTGDR